jgi:predicted lipoprotein
MMGTEAGTIKLSKVTAKSAIAKRSQWRRTVLLVGGAVVVLAMIMDTKVVRIGSSDDLRQAGFSAETYGTTTFPKIKAAIEERAIDATELASALSADKPAAVAKYSVASESGPVFSTTLTGVAADNPVSGVYEIKAENLPAEIKIRVQTGPAINGTELRDATGTVKFGQFTNQIEYQNAGSALNNEMKKEVLSAVDTKTLAGKTVKITGAFRMINPKSWLITPVRLEVK